MTLHDALDYEIRASWWASWVGVRWAQWLAGRYYARKVTRKWNRYVASLEASRTLRPYS